MSHIPLSTGPTIPFTPDAIGTIVPATETEPARIIKNPDVEFYLRIPNWEDRDLVSLRMYALNVRDVTADQIQNLILSELFEVMPDEAAADEAARFLEGFWQRQRQHAIDLQEWQEQEAIRVGDELEAGKTFEASQPPAELVTIKERARVNTLVADVTDGSQRLRDKLADQQLYATRFAQVIARLQIAGWKGLKTEAAFEPTPAMDAPVLTKSTIESLRSELMELDNTGAAWRELTAECEHCYDLPRSAEKNLSSPPESSSPRAGSTTRSTGSARKGGSSTSRKRTDAPST